MSENAWARAVATKLDLTEDDEAARVAEVLKNGQVRAGRARGRHRMKVHSIYFAGIKHLKGCDFAAAEDADQSGEQLLEPPAVGIPSDMASPGRSDAESAIDLDQPSGSRLPFAFAHTLSSAFTAFATDHINDAGKSTILGIILWALRGDPPTPTLQSDIRNRWLREIAVVVEIDGATFMIAWRVDRGQPQGGIYGVVAGARVEVSDWVEAALAAANVELADTAGDVTWPAMTQVAAMAQAGQLRVVATYGDDDEFTDSVGDFMLARLELDPVRTWAKKPNAVDDYDGSLIEHGWLSLSAALAIIDPTVETVMGEHVMLTQHLLGVFLGAKWSHTVYAARRNLRRTQSELASLRRRAKADYDASTDDLTKLQAELAAKKDELLALGDVPDYDVVLAATRHANSAALLAQKARISEYEAAAAYGLAERELASARRELSVQTEAQVTKRFFHSLRPSCCPRCDAELNPEQIERERDGHCSLCDREFMDQPTVSGAAASGTESDSVDGDAEDDSIAAIRDQVEDLKSLVTQLSQQHDTAREAAAAAERAARDSAGALIQLDRDASVDRRQLENEIARLEGRVAEREGLSNDRVGA